MDMIKKRFRDMKIGKKLLLSFLIVTVISDIGGIAGLAAIVNTNRQYSGALTKYGFAQGDVGMFNTEFNNGAVLLRDMILQTAAGDREKSYKELQESDKKLNAYYAKIKDGIVTEKERNDYNDIKVSLDAFQYEKTQVIEFARQGLNEGAYSMLENAAKPLSDNVRSAVEKLILEKTTGGVQQSQALAGQEKLMILLVIFVIILSFAVSLIIAVYISRGISSPMKEMAEAAGKMSQGDLTARIAVRSKNEIGQFGVAFSSTIQSMCIYIDDIESNLAKAESGDLTVKSTLEYKGDFIVLQNSLNHIILSMKNLISGIRQSAVQVSQGADQVSNGAQELAQASLKQMNSVRSLAARVSEIMNHARKNNANALSVNEHVRTANQEIEHCGRQMNQMVQAMSQITDSSNEIGKIIKTIENLAFQTNILSLNAAVEAARAGEAGKGFAVVAAEVKNLAGQSSESAKNTAALIENLIQNIQNGSNIVVKTAASLQRVIETTLALTSTIDEILKASMSQQNVIRQINTDVEEISAMAEMNSATAEESAAASEELSGLAQSMKQMVNRFKVSEDKAEAESSEPGMETVAETTGTIPHSSGL